MRAPPFDALEIPLGRVRAPGAISEGAFEPAAR